MKPNLDEVTPSEESRNDENEMRMCADCLGYGRVDNRPCVYCKGAGRVLTCRALKLRQERAARMAAAAPALYDALRALAWHSQNKVDLCWCDVKSNFGGVHTEECKAARAALALVDGPQTKETK